METTIKISSHDYRELRRHIPVESPAREAIDKATPIAHALEGIDFEGYAVTCTEEQAEIIFGIAKQYCPDMIPEIESGVALTQPTAAKPSRS
jgi:hypothetical protein